MSTAEQRVAGDPLRVRLNTIVRRPEANPLSTQPVILDAFGVLIAEARHLLQAAGFNGISYDKQHPPLDRYLRFRTEALNLIRRACGEDSDHYRELRRIAEHKDSAGNAYFTAHCLGVVEAAERDFRAGRLFDLRSLVAAELLGDFLDQSEALLGAGYHVPAASLGGAVLEDTLRKLAARHGISVPDRTTIEGLNVKLAKAAVYDKLVQKHITALADIRNNADHGHFDRFAPEDVADMIRWLRRFAADYLG